MFVPANVSSMSGVTNTFSRNTGSSQSYSFDEKIGLSGYRLNKMIENTDG